MGEHFSHLTRVARYQLESLLQAKVRVADIARFLGVHRSTVYREIRRAQVELRDTMWVVYQKYSSDLGQAIYEQNMKKKGRPKKLYFSSAFREWCLQEIVKKRRSPEVCLIEYRQRFKKEAPVCLRTLYNYIHEGLIEGVSSSSLPVGFYKKRRYRKVQLQKRFSAGCPIGKRPEEINRRVSFGHWEMDTVYSGKSSSLSCLLVLTERKTRKVLIRLIEDRRAHTIVKALDVMEQFLGKEKFATLFQSITVDNGSEFSDLHGMQRSCFQPEEIRTKLYFCNAYASYERGSVENQNRLIRRFFPKKTDFSKVRAAEVARVEEWMNHYPRKVLMWHTAEELYIRALQEVG